MSQISAPNHLSAQSPVGRNQAGRLRQWTALAALAFLLCVGTTSVRAETINNWIGGTGDWNTAGNWSAGVVPNDGGGVFYDVNINGLAPQTVTFDASPTVVDTLSLLSAGQRLQDNGTAVSLTIGDAASPNPVTGNLLNKGSINWGNGASLTVGIAGASTGFIDNRGTIDIGAGSAAGTLQVNGGFQNGSHGTLIFENGSTATTSNVFVNAGGVANVGSGGSTLQANSISQFGTMTVANGGTVSTGAFDVTGGLLQGSGTIKASTLTLSAGTLQPGLANAPGTLTLNGLYNQTGGVFSEQIGGAGSVGVLNTNGAVSLGAGSTLGINLVNGFTPSIGETFGIVNSGAGIFNGAWGNAPQGAFTSNGLKWSIDYGNLNETQIALTYGGIAFPTTATEVLTLSGTIVSQTVTPVLVNPGVMNVQQGSSLTVTTPVLINTGVMNVQQASLLTVNGNATNNGTINTGNAPSGAGNNTVVVTGLFNNTVTSNVNLLGTGDTMTVGGGSSNAGNLVVTGGSQFIVNGNFTNSGSLVMKCSSSPCGGAAFAPVQINGTLTNTGTIDVPQTEEEVLRGGLTLETAQSVANSGNVALGLIDAFIVVGFTEVPEPDFNNLRGGSLSLTADSDTVAIPRGNFNNDAGASVTMSGANDEVRASNAFVNGGTVNVSGHGDTIVAPLVTNTGTVSIGAGSHGNPGDLTIHGDYTQGPAGDLIIEINGPGSGQFGLLDVLGTASLDGDVTFDFGFTPLPGEAFTFLAANVLSGTFSGDTFNGLDCSVCSLSYDLVAGTVTLDINGALAIPEPGSLVLFGTGALGLAGLGLRRRSLHRSRNANG